MLNNDYYIQVFHEIKNSVTLINSYLQLIEKKYPEISSSEYWITSKNETTRLRAIATEISQVKFGSDLHLERMDLRSFLADCCSGFRCAVGTEGSSCTCSLALSQNSLVVLADPTQLRHAIINLLKNACEAMNYHGEIFVEALQADSHTLICITDLGGGIAPGMLEQIFEPFVTTKDDGSGLGLNITRQIVTAHNGNLSVESREGEGCTFTISLPTA